MWAEHYPRPLAELISVVTQPFDDDDVALAPITIQEHKVARRELRGIFPRDGKARRPSGGEIEGPLLSIAHRLLKTLRVDATASLAADRLDLALRHLDGVAIIEKNIGDEDLVVPEIAERLADDVPFGMWR
jgi:hypothetical protein